MATIHVGDIGTQLIALIQDGNGNDVDLTSITAAKFYINRNTKVGNVIEVTPTVWLDPLDNKNKLRYVTIAGDISVPGIYVLQAWIQSPDGSWSSTTYSFNVASNII